MKAIITAILLSLSTFVSATEMTIPITYVIDGDTIKGKLSLPCPLCDVSIRIRDIDTPEKGGTAKCEKEKVLGLLATEYMKEVIGSHESMTVKDIKWDKFGGRIDAYVFVGGFDIGEIMVLKGYAKFYDGKGPKPNWCN